MSPLEESQKKMAGEIPQGFFFQKTEKGVLLGIPPGLFVGNNTVNF